MSRAFAALYPTALDRDDFGGLPPPSQVLNEKSLRVKEGSSPDEGVPEKTSGWRGHGDSMSVGVWYTSRVVLWPDLAVARFMATMKTISRASCMA